MSAATMNTTQSSSPGAQPRGGERLNSISIDVEEYFHASNLGSVAPPCRWHALPQRVDASTHKVLDLLDKCNTRATFFVLGYVARRHPQLIREIVTRGHEIASHGYGHQLVYDFSEKHFYRDVYRTKRLLEDLCGTLVRGYRAPSFSIGHRTPWAHSSLVRAGYRYDSSVYPIRHPRYGNRHMPRSAFVRQVEDQTLYVFPLAVYEVATIRLPIAGGAYWRLLPEWLIHFGLRRLCETSVEPFHCYAHPWEFDANQPKFEQLSFLTKLRHYGGTSGLEQRVERILHSTHFGPIREVAQLIFPNFPS